MGKIKKILGWQSKPLNYSLGDSVRRSVHRSVCRVSIVCPSCVYRVSIACDCTLWLVPTRRIVGFHALWLLCVLACMPYCLPASLLACLPACLPACGLGSLMGRRIPRYTDAPLQGSRDRDRQGGDRQASKRSGRHAGS